MKEQIGYFMGEPVSEMSRERLLDVVEWLGRAERQRKIEDEALIAMLEKSASRTQPQTFWQFLLRRVAK